ncbi:MAG: hypothetical protein K9N06_04450 [Candidatus Cloacimonetes bacterium]|nr:hypothetical protein [Candidatus Cloacimonadota bacterium]
MVKAILLKKSAAWQNLLTQMGICYKILEETGSPANHNDCQLFIINGSLDVETCKCLEESHIDKIAVITTPEASRTAVKESIRTDIVVNGDKYYFDRPLVFYQKSDRIVKKSSFLPFSLDEAFKWKGSIRKQFYSKQKEMPTENVRKTNLQEVFRFTWNFLLDALEEKKLIPVTSSLLPDNRPLFIFRIDTDFATERDTVELYEICRKHNINASWFVDVHSEKLLSAYTKFTEQEIALHCDRHYVYRKMEPNERNIVRANQALLNAGLAPRGFAAPFGAWNPELEKVLFAHDYLYSSEFAYAYDALPIIRWQENKRILQIPVHPINPGRLRRSHFREQEIGEYFIDYIRQCSSRGVPAIIYHHPSLILNALIPRIFEYVNKHEFNNLTMENYAIWWLKRAENLCRIKSDEVLMTTELKRDIINYPADYERIYKKSWRYWLHEWEARKARLYFKRNGYPQYLD